MLYTEILEDGRTHTYSDTYKIKQLDTGVIYDNAVDTIFHAYKETDIPLEEKELTDAEFRSIIEEAFK